MAGRRRLYSLPNDEECEQCDSTLFYIQDGRYFCERDHLQETRRLFELDDDAGLKQASQGRVSRRAKEAKAKPARHLSGIQAKELYLECLQLLLRKQVYKLVSQRMFPVELETIVRDLWDLRIRGFNAVSSSRDHEMAQDDGNVKSEESASSAPEESGSLAMYNTQTDDDTDGAVRARGKSKGKIQDWGCERPDDWKPPKFIETLAICWLGCVILRLPTRIGDILRMANANHLPYISAIEEIPQAMRDRLPATYVGLLSTHTLHLTGNALHDAAMSVAKSYHYNYQLTFPPLNKSLLLLRYLREMAVPPELYIYVDEVAGFLGANFSIPVQDARTGPLRNPDILLAVLFAVAVKLLYPFDGVERHVMAAADDAVPRVDWEKWALPLEDEASGTGVIDLTAEGVWTASDALINEFLSSREAAQGDGSDRAGSIDRLFSIERPSAAVNTQHAAFDSSSGQDMDDVVRQMTRNIKLGNQAQGRGNEVPSKAPLQLGDRYEQYASPDDLDRPSARAFHGRLAHLAGLELQDLLRYIHRLERRLLRRQQETRTVEESSGEESR